VTTIIADAEAGVMVADSKTTDGSVKWSSQKIERIGDSIFGAAGEAQDIETFLAWIRRKKAAPKPRIKDDDFVAIELNQTGLFRWEHKLKPFPPGSSKHAIGTGAMAAMAALEMGASAERACEVACLVDDASGLPLQVLKL
jgi:hypothetical protein